MRGWHTGVGRASHSALEHSGWMLRDPRELSKNTPTQASPQANYLIICGGEAPGRGVSFKASEEILWRRVKKGHFSTSKCQEARATWGLQRESGPEMRAPCHETPVFWEVQLLSEWRQGWARVTEGTAAQER